jgi:hypothetical protein
MLPKLEIRLRSPVLRADEHRERQIALDTLQLAIERAAEALPQATTDERAIERFQEYFDLTKLWKLVAEEVEPHANPVILCKDILRRANTLMARIPELFAAKRRVTHFKTAPPVTPAPEGAKGNTPKSDLDAAAEEPGAVGEPTPEAPADAETTPAPQSDL